MESHLSTIVQSSCPGAVGSIAWHVQGLLGRHQRRWTAATTVHPVVIQLHKLRTTGRSPRRQLCHLRVVCDEECERAAGVQQVVQRGSGNRHPVACRSAPPQLVHHHQGGGGGVAQDVGRVTQLLSKRGAAQHQVVCVCVFGGGGA